MKRTLLSVFAFVMIIILTACASESGEPDPITFASYQKGYEATAPGDWKRLSESDAGESDLVLESADGAAAFLIYGEKKSDYALTAEEYYDAVLNMTAYELNTLDEDKVELKDAEPIVINNQTAEGYEFNYSDNVLNMYFQLYFFETEENYVRVICSAKVSEFEEYKAVLKKIAESIEIK